MVKPHQGKVNLNHSFEEALGFLKKHGPLQLRTLARKKEFTAEADTSDDGKPIIRFRQNETTYSKSYDCCWGHRYNHGRTYVAGYCRALDSAIE